VYNRGDKKGFRDFPWIILKRKEVL